MIRGLVLLHGFTGSGASWTSGTRAALKASGLHTVCPDLPGHGAHGRDPAHAVDLDHALDSIAVAVEEATVDGRPPVLLGYSMGGRLALHFALRSGGSISGLILESASPGIEDGAERAAREVADRTWVRLLHRRGIEAFVDRWEVLPIFAGLRRRPAAERDALRGRRLAADPAGLAAALDGLGTGALPSLWSQLGSVDVPTLLLVGEDDVKFCGIATAMLEQLPRGRVCVVPQSGHVVHLEAPEAWVAAVAAFGAEPTP